jgi:hypothetical protein
MGISSSRPVVQSSSVNADINPGRFDSQQLRIRSLAHDQDSVGSDPART